MQFGEYSINFLSGRDMFMFGIVFVCFIMIIDDVVIDFLAILFGIKPHKMPPQEVELMNTIPEKKIVIFMANWHEDQMLEPMVSGNIKGINYKNYNFLIGVYPNDLPTLNAARRLEKKFPHVVEVFVNTMDGPTSKGQLINLMANHIDDYNKNPKNIPYDLILTHDAEDVIHKDSLKLINLRAEKFEFIQIPVYSLPTPMTKLTAGIYIDEFVECHTKDILVRNYFDAGFPAAGVGQVTSYRVLTTLKSLQDGFYLKRDTLTEDYFLGLTCHDLKIPSHFSCDFYEYKDAKTGKIQREYIATRELFPQQVKTSIKQKTRWTLGISLQGYSHRPWKSSNFFAFYFLWRDRKGLVSAPAFTFSLFFSAYTISSYSAFGTWPVLDYQPWQNFLGVMMWSIFILSMMRILNRIFLVTRIYGAKMASGVPVRWVMSNFINTACTYNAVHQWFRAKYLGVQLAWSKTEHIVPEGFGKSDEDEVAGESVGEVTAVETKSTNSQAALQTVNS
ncbi:MAG: glycosyltransferase [Pseudobdellovibrio sp.]